MIVTVLCLESGFTDNVDGDGAEAIQFQADAVSCAGLDGDAISDVLYWRLGHDT